MSRDAAIARLSAELGDDALARALIDRHPELATRLDLLTMTAPYVARHRIASIVAFAFGNRIDHGETSPGPVNEALARTIESFVQEQPVPVYAQWEIADVLGIPCHAIRPERDDSGQETYLSTEGVVLAALARGLPRHRVGIVAFGDHAVRCVMTCGKHGVDAAVPEGLALPNAYDSRSGQPWTRDRPSYVAIDLLARQAFG